MRPSLLFAFLLLCFGVSARADSATPIDIAQGVRFDQNLGVQVPLDLPFISDTGALKSTWAIIFTSGQSFLSSITTVAPIFAELYLIAS